MHFGLLLHSSSLAEEHPAKTDVSGTVFRELHRESELKWAGSAEEK